MKKRAIERVEGTTAGIACLGRAVAVVRPVFHRRGILAILPMEEAAGEGAALR